MNENMLINRREFKIEFGDCDPGGIVYFPRYFEFCDACTIELFERAGLRKREMLKTYGIAGIPMVEVQARFLAPSQYGESLVVESCVAAWRRSSFSVHHKVFRGDVLAAEVFEKRVWVTQTADAPVQYKGLTIPQEVKDRFSGRPPLAVHD